MAGLWSSIVLPRPIHQDTAFKAFRVRAAPRKEKVGKLVPSRLVTNEQKVCEGL